MKRDAQSACEVVQIRESCEFRLVAREVGAMDADGLRAYLSKDNLTPTKTASKYWYQVSGATQCAASMGECEFMSMNKQPEQQLAKK